MCIFIFTSRHLALLSLNGIGSRRRSSAKPHRRVTPAGVAGTKRHRLRVGLGIARRRNAVIGEAGSVLRGWGRDQDNAASAGRSGARISLPSMPADNGTGLVAMSSPPPREPSTQSPAEPWPAGEADLARAVADFIFAEDLLSAVARPRSSVELRIESWAR